MKHQPQCSVVITNYNTWSLTEACVSALQTHCKGTFAEIIVVDDGSLDAAPHSVSSCATVVRNERTLGYVKSVNRGIQSSSEDLILVLDSDAAVRSNCLAQIMEEFQTNVRLGALGFMLRSEANEVTPSAEKEPTLLGFLLGQRFEHAARQLYERSTPLPICLHSCAIAIRRKAYETIGGFDEVFDFSDADVDFSMRLRNAGWEIAVCDKIEMFHRRGGSDQTSAQRIVRHHKNRWILLSKHRKLLFADLLRGLLVCRHGTELLIFHLLKRIHPSPELHGKIESRRTLMRDIRLSYPT